MGQDRRQLAIAFNQRTRELLDNKQRSPEEAEEMIEAAHASLAHWREAGTGVNWQRGGWLIARAYAETGSSHRDPFHGATRRLPQPFRRIQ